MEYPQVYFPFWKLAVSANITFVQEQPLLFEWSEQLNLVWTIAAKGEIKEAEWQLGVKSSLTVCDGIRSYCVFLR